MKKFTFSFLVFGIIIITGHAQNLSNIKVPIKYEYNDDTLSLSIVNPFQAPIRVMVTTTDSILNSVFNNGTLLLSEKRDTLILIKNIKNKPILNFKVLFGDPSKEISAKPMALPYPKGKSYKIVQANFGAFSHNSIDSKYALDFNLSIGDTICAADDGFIIGIVNHNNTGGNNLKYYDRANYITIYHPLSHAFSQYVHLIQDGAIVKVGQFVKKGEVIGMAGVTGYTAGPHLHFNVYKANLTGWESAPAIFEDGSISTKIRRGQNLKRK